MQKTDHIELIEREEHIELAARALKAMSHPLRLRILCVLGDQEMSVQDIVEMVGTTQSNISQHLANRVYYRVSDPRTLKLISLMRDVFCGFDTED